MRLSLLLGILWVTACGPTTPTPSTSATAGSEAAPAAAAEIPEDTPLPAAGEPRFVVPLEGAPAKGAADPLVTLVVFTDFECPFCQRDAPTLDALLERYPAELRLVFRHNPLPFHRHAVPAAEASLEAYAQGGDAAFWRMHDRLFSGEGLERQDLERFAEELGLDLPRFRQALDDERHHEALARDVQLAARIGARGTPGHFINGRVLMGAQGVEQFERIVQEEIALARQEIEGGAPRAGTYTRRMENALAEAPQPPPPPSRAPPPPDDTLYAIPVADSATHGPEGALVTLVMFTDFECPFCRRVVPTLAALEERYGADLRLVLKHFPLPFHSRAGLAHEAVLEAQRQGGPQAAFRLHDLLFTEPGELERGDILGLAERAGLDLERLTEALDHDRHVAAIEVDQALGARLGVRGTPTFFINGQRMVGAQPLERFVAMIEAQKARAEALLANGTRRGELYEALIADGVRDVAQAERSRLQGALPVPEDAPLRGPADAPITLQIFSDFQCPYCARALPIVERIEATYGERVRIVWRHLPLSFHEHAELAAEAALEVRAQVGDGGFWTFHDLLFANQRSLEQEHLESYAAQIPGVDVAALRQALADHRHRARVRADAAAASAAGIRGTPTFLLQDQMIRGAQPFLVFEEQIDALLDP